MSAFKKVARQLVDRLPAAATWDDLFEAAYARAAAEGARVAEPLAFARDPEVDRLFTAWRVDAVDRLPDDATWDDLLELAEIARATAEGVVEADRGEFASPADVEQAFAGWRNRAGT